MVNDPIADFATRINNALAIQKTSVHIPYSKMKEAIGKVLEAEGLLSMHINTSHSDRKVIEMALEYNKEGVARITRMVRISKPGRRTYVGSKEIRLVKNGKGLSIITTPTGLMTGKEARKAGVGGELLLNVW